MVMSCIQGMKISLTTILMSAKALHYTYDRGSLLLFKSTFVYLCQSLDMNVNLCTYTYCHCIFIIENIRVFLDFIPPKKCI